MTTVRDILIERGFDGETAGRLAPIITAGIKGDDEGFTVTHEGLWYMLVVAVAEGRAKIVNGPTAGDASCAFRL